MLRALLDRRLRQQRAELREVAAELTADWFPEQRAFYDDPAQLVAAIKGRRAGGTKAGCAHFIRSALEGGDPLLYLNSTRGEAERLAWWGLRNDGMASLIERHKIPADLNFGKLEIRFPNGALIMLRGADDEAELRKALGFAYKEIWWDEAQKIPPKISPSIREVMMPALLDKGGRLRFVGTPTRQMAGMFWEVTQPTLERRAAGWSVHHWTLLDNPFFGATRQERWVRGMLALQKLLGGPEVAPLDSPIMRREGFGEWTAEDATFVYHVGKVERAKLMYAPHRLRADGFVDVPRALADLPWPAKDAFFSLGADLGYSPDPFALVLWAWHPHDPRLHEVVSWKKHELTSDQQAKCLHDVRAHVTIGQVVSDAGAAKGTVAGWSQEWIERYGLPILEAQKRHKSTAIEAMNADIRGLNIQLRDGGPLYDEMSQLQWSALVTGSGTPIEEPSQDNHCCDAGLYSHRHSYQYRWSVDEKAARRAMAAPERGAIEARALEAELEEDEALYH